MFAAVALLLVAQTAGLGINPGRAEIEMKPGQNSNASLIFDNDFKYPSSTGQATAATNNLGQNSFLFAWLKLS